MRTTGGTELSVTLTATTVWEGVPTGTVTSALGPLDVTETPGGLGGAVSGVKVNGGVPPITVILKTHPPDRTPGG